MCIAVSIHPRGHVHITATLEMFTRHVLCVIDTLPFSRLTGRRHLRHAHRTKAMSRTGLRRFVSLLTLGLWSRFQPVYAIFVPFSRPFTPFGRSGTSLLQRLLLYSFHLLLLPVGVYARTQIRMHLLHIPPAPPSRGHAPLLGTLARIYLDLGRTVGARALLTYVLRYVHVSHYSLRMSSCPQRDSRAAAEADAAAHAERQMRIVHRRGMRPSRGRVGTLA